MSNEREQRRRSNLYFFLHFFSHSSFVLQNHFLKSFLLHLCRASDGKLQYSIHSARRFWSKGSFLYILLVSNFSAGVKSFVTCLIHARISEREEGQGEEEGQKTASDFSIYFFLCVFLSCFVLLDATVEMQKDQRKWEREEKKDTSYYT